jgi:sulfur carrier protein ThiS
MATVRFTPQLERFLSVPAPRAAGATVAEVLDAVFSENPRLQGYVLDDQGRVRRHVAVFVDGEMIQDRIRLSDPVSESGEIFVMQALSGG